MFCRFLFVLLCFFFTIVLLSVHLRFTFSDYPFGTFKLFLHSTSHGQMLCTRVSSCDVDRPYCPFSLHYLPFASSFPVFFGEVRVAIFFLVFCVVLLCVFTNGVTFCDVCYDFRIKTMFCSSLPAVVCKRAHNGFFLRLVYPMQPDSLDCPFLIAPSVFPNVYLH